MDQHRVHDKGNRLTQIEDNPSPILLDRAGRMRQLPPDASGDWNESLELKWDAWGRITQVNRVSDSEVLGGYAYDGLTRRITRVVDSVLLHSYYSDQWRALEERKDSDTDASAQYLWGARHRDDLVRRDRDSDDDGDLDETRYALMDYYSPASITDETGAVTERYAFSAFGIRRIMTPDWSPRSTSECALEFAFQGQFLDAESGLINYGYRYYSPETGRWVSRDPSGERGGFNLNAYVANNPLGQIDLLGLAPVDYTIPIPPGLANKNCVVHLIQLLGNDAMHSMTSYKPANGAVAGNVGAGIRPDGTLSPVHVPKMSELTKRTEIYLCCCMTPADEAAFERAKNRMAVPPAAGEHAPGTPGTVPPSCTSTGCATYSGWRNAGIAGVPDPTTGAAIDPSYLNRPGGGAPLNPQAQGDTPDILRNMLRAKCLLVRTVLPYKP